MRICPGEDHEKKVHPLADVIGFRNVRRGLNQFKDGDSRRLGMPTISDEVVRMFNL